MRTCSPEPIAALAALVLALAGCTVQPAGDTARDCAVCPEMVTLPAGSYLMGTAEGDRLIDPRTGKPATNDGPQHRVTLAEPFAIGRYEITVGEFAAFIDDTGYETVDRCMEFSKENAFRIGTDVNWGNTGFRQLPGQPVVCVSWYDAIAYTEWLSELTGEPYRLPSEAEWEYAARAGALGPYHWGDDAADSCAYANVRSPGADAISPRQAESDVVDGFPCDDGFAHSSPAGSYAANDFGLHDMQGNAWEWMADCNHKDYTGAPADGSAWLEDEGTECRFGVIRGGSFINRVERSSVTVRAGRPRSSGATNMGFRVAKGDTLDGVSAGPVTRTAADFGDSAGGNLFRDNCGACHLRSDDFEGLYGTSQQELEAVIRNGGNNVMSMPAFGEVLGANEISALATYLRFANGWD